MAKYKRTIVVLCGDKQAGHEGALLNPDTELPFYEIDESGNKVATKMVYPELRPVQRRLWQWHESDIKEVSKLAGKDRIVYVGMGDETQGNKYHDDLSELSMYRQTTMAYYNMLPWMELPNLSAVYFTIGTPSHVFGDGDSEYAIVDRLKRSFARKKIGITHHWMLDIDGFKLDVAHHGAGAGKRSWTRGNEFEYYAKSIMIDNITAGESVPDGLVRAHHHEPIYRHPVHQVAGQVWEMPSWIVPPYCFIGAYAVKVAKSPSRMTVGMIALELINGRLYDWHYEPFYHSISLLVEEKV